MPRVRGEAMDEGGRTVQWRGHHLEDLGSSPDSLHVPR